MLVILTVILNNFAVLLAQQIVYFRREVLVHGTKRCPSFFILFRDGAVVKATE